MEVIVVKESNEGIYLSIVHHHKQLNELLWTCNGLGFLKIRRKQKYSFYIYIVILQNKPDISLWFTMKSFPCHLPVIWIWRGWRAVGPGPGPGRTAGGCWTRSWWSSSPPVCTLHGPLPQTVPEALSGTPAAGLSRSHCNHRQLWFKKVLTMTFQNTIKRYKMD